LLLCFCIRYPFSPLPLPWFSHQSHLYQFSSLCLPSFPSSFIIPQFKAFHYHADQSSVVANLDIKVTKLRNSKLLLQYPFYFMYVSDLTRLEKQKFAAGNYYAFRRCRLTQAHQRVGDQQVLLSYFNFCIINSTFQGSYVEMNKWKIHIYVYFFPQRFVRRRVNNIKLFLSTPWRYKRRIREIYLPVFNLRVEVND
jgi:hypothetical protein